MQSLPGSSFTTNIVAIVPGTAEGTLTGSAALPSIAQLMGTSQFAVRLELPEDLPEHAKRLGMSGSATMITEDAGPIGILAHVLFWLRMQFNYL